MANQNLNITIKAFDKTKGALGSAAKGIKAVGSSLFSMKTALIGVAGVAGFGLLVRSSLNATDSLAKTSSKIGTTTEALAKMRFAAELTGVAATTMDMALQRFTRRTAEAAKGTGEAKGALRELNIDAKAMLKLPLDEQMRELAKAFEGVETPADKVRLAMKLFDSEGVALVNTLGLGADALTEMMNEADALGITLSSSAAKGVEDANDSFTRLKTLLKGLTDQTVAKLAPALQAVTDKLVAFGKEAAGGDFEKIGATIANKIIEGFKKIVVVFQSILNVIGETAHTIKQVYRNIFSSADTKKNELELERLKKAAFKAGISIAKALDPDSNYIERLSDANREIVLNINRVQGELNRISAVETEEYSPFDFSDLLAQLNEVQQAVGSAVPDFPEIKPDITGVNNAKEAFKQWSDAIEPVDSQLQSLGVKTMDTFTNSISSAIQGTAKLSDSFKAMALNVVDSLTKMLVQYYITKPLFDMFTSSFGGTSATPSQLPMGSTDFQSGFNPQFIGNGGGFTGHGSRTGGLDGKGGFQAMLHPNETVIDHTKPSRSMRSSGGQSIVVNQTINLTTGIQSTVRAEIQSMMPQINESTKAAVAEARSRGGSYSKALLGV